MVEYAAYKKSLFGCKSMQVYVEIKADLEWKESIERSDPEGGEERVGGGDHTVIIPKHLVWRPFRLPGYYNWSFIDKGIKTAVWP